MATLIAGGDSFTYGNELADCKFCPSQHTYPALLAKRLSMDYHCAAMPGRSNSAIRRETMNACEAMKDDIGLVLITWTFPGRYEFRIADEWEQLTSWSIIDDSKSIKEYFHNDNPVVFDWHVSKIAKDKEKGIFQFAKVFYHYVGTFEYWELYASLCEIVMMQQYLELKKIPYLFTMVDHSLNNTSHFKNDATLTTLLQQLNYRNWMWFPTNLGFYEWAEQNKFPFATTHPLEPAHVEAEKIIYEYLRNFCGVS